MTSSTRPDAGRALLDDTPGILRTSPSGARSVVVAAITAVLLTVLGFVVKAHPVDVSGDVDLNRLRTGLVGTLASGVYHVFSPLPAVLLTALVAGVIWARTKDLRTAAAFAGVVAGTWLPLAVVKLIVNRPRPDSSLLAHPYTPMLTDASYPSGHTAFVASLAIALTMVLYRRRWRSAATAIGVLLVVLVAVSLVVDGVHFPSDVLASVIWCLAVAPAARYLWVDIVMPRLPLLGRPRSAATGRDSSDG